MKANLLSFFYLKNPYNPLFIRDIAIFIFYIFNKIYLIFQIFLFCRILPKNALKLLKTATFAVNCYQLPSNYNLNRFNLFALNKFAAILILTKKYNMIKYSKKRGSNINCLENFIKTIFNYRSLEA